MLSARGKVPVGVPERYNAMIPETLPNVNVLCSNDENSYFHVAQPPIASSTNSVNVDEAHPHPTISTRKLRLLDLFCGAGGCAVGYAQAGFEVVGVDIVPQPRYPYEFHCADALTFPLDGFDVIHASPPCQHFTMMLNHGLADRDRHPDLVDVIRKRLQASGKPYIIENVIGAPVERSVMLCGAMFGLRVYRHRLFESNIFLFQPNHPRHIVKAVHAGMIPRNGEFYSPVGNMGDKVGAQLAMGIDWMNITGSKDREIANAIPPAYTRWIGEQLMNYLQADCEVGA